MNTTDFRDFLIGKKGNDKLTSPQNEVVVAEDGTIGNEGLSNNGNEIRKKANAIKSFQRVLVNDVLETDDRLEQFILSILNLRERIWKTSLLSATKLGSESNRIRRMRYGYRFGSSNVLTSEDLELTIDHDLIQHEKMMSTCRKLLSSLGQSVESLGRRLHDLGFDEECHVFYIEVSKELYRKQQLAAQLFDSANDTKRALLMLYVVGNLFL
jgi:hypothetical protein